MFPADDISLNPSYFAVPVPTPRGNGIPPHVPMSPEKRKLEECHIRFELKHVVAHLNKIGTPANLAAKDAKARRYKPNKTDNGAAFRERWCVDGHSLYIQCYGSLEFPKNIMINFKGSNFKTRRKVLRWLYKCFGIYFVHVFEGDIFKLHPCLDISIPHQTCVTCVDVPCKIVNTCGRPERYTVYFGKGKHQTAMYEEYRGKLRTADDLDGEEIEYATRFENRLTGKKAKNVITCLAELDVLRSATPFAHLKIREIDHALLMGMETTSPEVFKSACTFLYLLSVKNTVRTASKRMNKIEKGNFKRIISKVIGKPRFHFQKWWDKRVDNSFGDLTTEEEVRDMMQRCKYKYSKMAVDLKDIEKAEDDDDSLNA